MGRYSLLAALLFLGPVIVIAESAAHMVQTERYAALIENSLVIGAWVALWRPIEIFLYDWWPIRAEARLFDRLSQMDVRTIRRRRPGATTRRRCNVSAGPVTAADRRIESSTRSAALWRGAAFFLLWMVLMQSMKPADLAVGALAASAQPGSACA